MSTKKEARYIELATGAHMKLSLDPDIYDTATGTKLGVLSAIAPAAKYVPFTLRQAARSTGASFVRVVITKGTGESEETRAINLICSTDKLSDVKGTGAGKLTGDTLKIGGAVTSNWIVKSVS